MMVPSSSMVVVALSLLGVVSALPTGQKNSKLKSDSPYPFPYVTRAQWRGRPPTSVTPLVSPAPLVLIHHSFEPAACRDRAQCSRAMRLMQDYHQMHQGWADIGYNFAVGSDGVVYEARGWSTVGAHASSYNSKSIGIVLIGDWIETVPPPSQLQAAKDLIRAGVDLGFISPTYTLAGHRNVGSTECPGQALYKEIQTWDHFRDTL
ncbi:unnamed protein product [Plutella xylostella]|uniref:Peptidoglycan-recognition protein n=1 Tax=Plutella xylostella TaxID=51655 RepID=A0A8S4DPL9_PLUXY|nr:unnamed protein product [Plutella xylostella]